MRRLIFSVMAALSILLSTTAAAAPQAALVPSTTSAVHPEAVPEFEISRIAGDDRYETASQMALGWAGGADKAFVVLGTDFPDALAAVAPATTAQAPVLLTRESQLPAGTQQALAHIQPQEIVLVGGSQVISDEVADQLRAYAATVTRVAGVDRYDTAVALSQGYAPQVDRVYLANGLTFPDALSGGALAGYEGVPLLLTRPDRLPQVVAEELARLAPTEVIVLGGEASVTDATALAAAQSAGISTYTRIAGADRYETSSRIAERFAPGTAAYVASGVDYPDALVSGVPGALTASPVLLTAPAAVPSSTADVLISRQPPQVWVVGGEASVHATAMSQIESIMNGETTTETGREVFAHYFPPYPISLDNTPPAADYYTRNYLAPDGEGGIHLPYGGLLRDRPVEQDPLDTSGWRVENLRTEVVQAQNVGIDGFTLNLMSGAGQNWTASVNLMQAAEDVGDFGIVPNLDTNGSIASLPIPVIAERLAELYEFDSAHTIDGTPLLSSFKAEGRSVEWWAELIDTLESEHGVSVHFIAVFLHTSQDNMEQFAPISYGFGNWGGRSPGSFYNSPDHAATAHAMGKVWMAPVAFQDVRPHGYSYAESSNTETLRASWEMAIERDADLVQVVTWNDYGETTHFAPSAALDDSLLEFSSYYIDWYHTGAEPAIVEDEVYISHRMHGVDAEPLLDHGLMEPTLTPSVTPRDTVEVVTRLTEPAEVTVQVGDTTTTLSAPAGIWSALVPLEVGSVGVSLSRGDATVLSAESPIPVVERPEVQDLKYHLVSGTP